MAGSMEDAFKKAFQKKDKQPETQREKISLTGRQMVFLPDNPTRADQPTVPVVIRKKRKASPAITEDHLLANQSQAPTKKPGRRKSRRKKAKIAQPKGQGNHEGGRWNSKPELQALRSVSGILCKRGFG